MKTLSIFVAGATDLSHERLALKAAANDLTAEFEARGVRISVLSYENFRDNQDEYNNFITGHADVVMFILDGRIGPKTRDEFILATRTLQAKNRPKIVVFMKEFDEPTLETKFIEGLMAQSGGDYWVAYRDVHDLVRKAEKRIRTIVSDRLGNKQTVKPLKSGPNLKPTLIGAALVIAAFVGGLLLQPQKITRSDTALLIVGGGSAANFVERNHKEFNLRDFPQGYYVHMPTGDSWLLLTEEVMSPQSAEHRSYIPVCLAASAANDSSFLKVVSKEHFLRQGSVVSFLLGYDTLCVYMKNSPALHARLAHTAVGSITTGELSNLIKQSEEIGYNVFTTSKNSGTRTVYNEALERSGFDFAKVETLQFSEDTDLPTINRDDKGYMLLGSTCYYAKKLKPHAAADGLLSLHVMEPSELGLRPVMKPIYLYCMAYVAKNNELEFPKETLWLLEQLGVADALPQTSKPGRYERATTSTVIHDAGSLLPIEK